MCPNDDIPLDQASSQTQPVIPPKAAEGRREIGPESEVRGGPEAADEDLERADRRDRGQS
jgi:hypothetical protein